MTPKTDSEERLCVIGETPLHIAIVYNDMKSVKLLVKHGVDVNKRVVGDYNASIQSKKSFKNQEKEKQRKFPSLLFRRSKPKTKQFNPQSENPESKTKRRRKKRKNVRLTLGHAYYGEYPLAFAAAFGFDEIYDFLIEHGADPNLQDSYGNTILHMLIIRDRMVLIFNVFFVYSSKRSIFSIFRICSDTRYDIQRKNRKRILKITPV